QVCMYHVLIEDANKIRQNYKKYLIVIPLLAVAFYGLSILISFIIDLFINDVSINQNDIENMILHGSAFLTFVSVVLIAPLVEELIYRKAIFNLLEKKPIWLSYLVSGICFMIPHMISSIGKFSVGDWLFMCIPYLSSGLMLCGIYHYTGKNIYASWFAHFVNNFIAFILIFAA
ncbi:MAG: CPBP family intramembrane metalloprotease, partial [Anaeroplasmataceae bacterium]|nr:CPBP family intramembrane metalloprotease [Anaeroplasmataceae bacterium]